MIRRLRPDTERPKAVFKTGICFTEKGRAVLDKLNKAAVSAGIEPVDIIGPSDTDVKIEDVVRSCFTERRALIFVGAVGIAVRLISGFVKDKLTDSPVIVIDDRGQFVIPILSGHAGGANKLAATVAELIDAIPVITTSTDVNGAFSPDVFATENHLAIRNRDGIKKVSAKAIEGKAVTISVKDYPPKEPVDIIVADETDREYTLLLSPKKYVIGIGMKKDRDSVYCEQFIISVLSKNGIDINGVYALATIDIKENEPAIKVFSNKYRIPVISFEASLLERAEGAFTSSRFVKETVGVDNVCERAAVLAAGSCSTMICQKTCGDGITLSIVKRR